MTSMRRCKVKLVCVECVCVCRDALSLQHTRLLLFHHITPADV